MIMDLGLSGLAHVLFCILLFGDYPFVTTIEGPCLKSIQGVWGSEKVDVGCAGLRSEKSCRCK